MGDFKRAGSPLKSGRKQLRGAKLFTFKGDDTVLAIVQTFFIEKCSESLYCKQLRIEGSYNFTTLTLVLG